MISQKQIRKLNVILKEIKTLEARYKYLPITTRDYTTPYTEPSSGYFSEMLEIYEKVLN